MAKKTAKMAISGANSFLSGFVSDSSEAIKNKKSLSLEGIKDIEVSLIYRPKQQRIFFDRGELEKLKKSIIDEGFRGAILIAPLPIDHKAKQKGFEYELVYGANRVLACEELNYNTIPSEVKQLTSQQIRRIRFDENMVRNNLNLFEVISGYLELMADEACVDIAQVEQDLNAMSNAAKRRSEVDPEALDRLSIYQELLDRYQGGRLSTLRSKLIKFRSLPNDVKTSLEGGKIHASKALEIGSVKDKEQRQNLLAWIVDQDPSVAEIRKRKRELLKANQTTRNSGEKAHTNTKKATTVMKRFSKLIESDTLTKNPSKVTPLLQQIEALIAQIEEIKSDNS